ncbi:GNAT family N-acetyltransferase [Candidatus Pelagibacter sp.]|nr:GNAT family N-acetyltransferase [Candidatus Pelagibacter sp.]
MNNQVKRNYLEIKSINDLVIKKKPSNILHLSIANPNDFQLNKFFYKQIGKKHKWLDRLVWSDKTWNDYLNTNGVNTYILKEKDDLIGYFEQIFSKENLDCEIAYFGILEEYIGKNLGGYLLSEAIKKSFEIGAKRVWVHTCSLDHKHALNNYISRGMKVFQTEIINL